jgi:hypothetical protein
MMTDDQRSRAAELKAAIAASGPATGGAPPWVRAAALALKEELRQTGTTARVLAQALGVHETTLCRWQHDGGSDGGPMVSAKGDQARGAGFRMVHVAAPDAKLGRVISAAATAPMVRGLRVAHAPSGLVVDGLDVETLAALLRRMS